MSNFEKDDMQVMDVVNGHASPEASARMEELTKKMEEWQNSSANCSGTGNMSQTALHQKQWCRIPCRLKALWRLIVIELLGYAALGGVLVAGMAMGVVPMGAAVPVFVACFMWVAVRLDRWLRR